MRRVAALALAALSVVAGGAGCGPAAPEAPPPPEALAARAARWLWSQQGADGGWHSVTYGFLRSGQALTPFVLWSLLDACDVLATRPAGGVDRALEFLRRSEDDEGALGRKDPDVLEYPTFATAYALRCFVLAGRAEDRPRVARMAAWLESRQYAEANGFAPSHPAYGGFGFGGRHRPGEPGHMDLAHTRRVLEALRDAGGARPVVLERARTFLRRMQNLRDAGAPPPPAAEADALDGGFWFSPVVLDANKSRAVGSRFASYATATCDGLLALLAAGVPASDVRVRAARTWLERDGDPGEVAGIEPAAIEWRSALRAYHMAVRAEVDRALGRAPTWRGRVADAAILGRRGDGAFVNPLPFMKEDDPLLATALVLTALGPGRAEP